MATEKQITEKWGATHHIQKQRLLGEIDLERLKPSESVAMGDGETHYWLLTEKIQCETPHLHNHEIEDYGNCLGCNSLEKI